MSDVDVAVGIRRAVVQNEFGAAFGNLAQFLIAFFILPLFHPSRFAFGKVAAHGKRRFVKINGFGVIGHGVGSVIVKIKKEEKGLSGCLKSAWAGKNSHSTSLYPL